MHMQCSQSRNNFLWGRQRLRIVASHTRYTQPIMPGCCVPTDMRVWEPFAAMPLFCLAGIGNKSLTNTKGKSAGFNAYEVLCNTGAMPMAPSHTTPHTPHTDYHAGMLRTYRHACMRAIRSHVTVLLGRQWQPIFDEYHRVKRRTQCF